MITERWQFCKRKATAPNCSLIMSCLTFSWRSVEVASTDPCDLRFPCLYEWSEGILLVLSNVFLCGNDWCSVFSSHHCLKQIVVKIRMWVIKLPDIVLDESKIKPKDTLVIYMDPIGLHKPIIAEVLNKVELIANIC